MYGPQTEEGQEIHADKYREPGEDFREYANRVANALNVPGFVAAFLADDLESHSLPDAVFRRAGGWEYPTMEARSDDSQRQPKDELIPIALDVSFQPDLPRKSQMMVARQVCQAL